MRILLLEDEYSLRISIKEFLEDIGYDVDGFMNGIQAHDAVYDKHYDLLLLDVNVPLLSGFELLQKLRGEGNKTPAIFLTSMVDLEDLKEGYKRGCCDYIRKPFNLEELELRVSQVFAQLYLEDSEYVDIGHDVTYDVTTSKLLGKDKEEIVLRKTEKDVLEVLIKHKNAVVSTQTLQDEVWGEYVEPATIRVQLNNLRKKLPDGVIQNRRGLGYIIER